MKRKANQTTPRPQDRAVCSEGKQPAPRAGDSHPRCWEQPPGHGPNQDVGGCRGSHGHVQREWQVRVAGSGTQGPACHKQAQPGSAQPGALCHLCWSRALNGWMARKVRRGRRGSAGRTRVPQGTGTLWWVLLVPGALELPQLPRSSLLPGRSLCCCSSLKIRRLAAVKYYS